MHASIGAKIDERYELLRNLGVGASGEVWLARDRQVPRTVAVKLMHTGLLVSSMHLERFQREVHSLNELGNTHPNIPQLYGANVLAERPYFVMEYIGGQSMSELMTSHMLFEIPFEKRISNIIGQLADALTFAHDRGIVHRDIKPDNVKIMGTADKTYLLDFSVAVLDPESTRSGIGTPRYIAPELQTSQAADIFSFAIVIFEILFRIHPIFDAADGANLRVMKAQRLMSDRLSKGDWKHPSQLATADTTLPANIDWTKIDAVFKHAFSLNPGERPNNAQAFFEGLQEALKNESTSDIVISMLSTGREQVDTQSEIGAVFDSGTITAIEPPENEPAEDNENKDVSPQPAADDNGSDPGQNSVMDPQSRLSMLLTEVWFPGLAGLLLGIIIGITIG
jgi:serine/threonine protein kinase